jgi:outer membrane protein assembly factor BamB
MMNPSRWSILLSALLALSFATGQARAQKSPGSVLWKHDAGSQLWSTPAHEGGTLYFGSDGGSVTALELAGQAVRWSFQTEGRVRSSMLCANGSVLFASDDGNLYCVEAAAGKERWRFELGTAASERVLPALTPPYEYDYLHSSPVESGGTVYVGSMDGRLYAVSIDSGEERWRFETAARIRSTPLVHEGVVYFGSWDGGLYAVDAGNGSLRWKFDTGGIVQSSPAYAEEKIIIGSRSATIFAVDAASGEQLWKHAHADGSWVESSPVISSGVVFIGSSDALRLFAFDIASGEQLWSFKTAGWSWSTPVLTEDTVYIGGISAHPYYFPGVTLERGFHAVERSSGAVRWSAASDGIEGFVTGGVHASPVIVDDTVYIATLDGFILALQN